MANTQINIIANGTKTLATAGKYCDRNIDVNVSVPASGITPSGSKSITTNGTHDVTNYANAVVNVPTGITPTGSININTNGTHDVTNYASAVVSVSGAQATQFTNLYDPANVHLKQTNSCSSSSGYQVTTDNYCNFVVIPYHHKANDPITIRIRGIGTVRDRANITLMKADGVTPESWAQFHNTVTLSYDEYGDVTLTCKSVLLTKEWYYLHLNFQYVGVNSGATEALTGPIITINEPIGNGGYAG